MTHTITEKPVWPIFIFVLLAHIALVVFLAFFVPSSPVKIQPKEKLVVRTLKLKTDLRSHDIASSNIASPNLTAHHPPAREEASSKSSKVNSAKVKSAKEKVKEPIPEPKQKEPAPEPIQKAAPQLSKTPTPVAPKAPVKIEPKLESKKAAKPAPKLQKKPIEKANPKPSLQAEKTPAKPAVNPSAKKNTPKAAVKIDPKIEAGLKRKEELLARVQGNLSKIQSTKQSAAANKNASLNSSSSEIKLPSALGELAVDTLKFDDSTSALTPRERGYRDELASRIKLLLKLPEYGMVKLKLTLSNTGKVLKVDVVSSKSSTNRTHIEKTLPHLSFPAFGESFGSESSHTFSINLLSD